MDEELQKRNTDCVYFLASPLTCKKGVECEYRHSEFARVNPRDCWYWLAGSCLNPTCSFRHPPLEGRTEAPSSESVTTVNPCPAPVNKTNVPCYYYFNGFCNKGNKCFFLHGPADSAPTWKPVKTASAVIEPLPQENKTSTVSDNGSVPIEARNNSRENIKPKDDFHPSPINKVVQRSASPHVLSASDCEEEARVDAFLPEGSVGNRTPICTTDQSSEEAADEGHVERDEWLESSPGFDVLVNGESEKLDYDDDPEYLKVLDNHYLGYEYEDHVEYDSTYPKMEMLYEQDMRETYDDLDNKQAIPGRSRERMLDSRLSRKRKFPSVNSAFDGPRGGGVDLRDHLEQRRTIDDSDFNQFSRRHEVSRGRNSRERYRRQHTRHLNRRLSSDVENYTQHDNEIMVNGSFQRGGTFRPTHINNRSRENYKEKREVSRKPVIKKRRSIEESSTFSGPKTLAEIKEEKKARENGNTEGRSSSRASSEDFQGPKPLNAILKNKSRLSSVLVTGNNGGGSA